MSAMVAVGEELMPHRETKVASCACDMSSKKISQDSSQTTPIRKLSRKQGLVIGEETSVEDSSVIEDCKNGGTGRKCKVRRLSS